MLPPLIYTYERRHIMIVANFTPDPVPWLHIGVSGTLKPGDVLEWDEARAKHVLNKSGRLGIVKMTYGDNEAIKRDDSMRLWRAFWELQVTNFNQGNEGRKAENKPYARPSKEIVEHAKRLQLELVGPWVSPAKTDDGAILELKEANKTLTGQLKELSALVSQMVKGGSGSGMVRPDSIDDKVDEAPVVNTPVGPPKVEGGDTTQASDAEPLTKAETDAANLYGESEGEDARLKASIPSENDYKFWNEFIKATGKLNKAKLAKMVKKDLANIKLYPDDVQLILRGKWDEQNTTEACPF